MAMSAELQERLSFLGIDETEIALLTALRPSFEARASDLVDAFYRHLLAFPRTRQLLRDPSVRDHLLRKQREYLVSLAGPTLDEDYVAERRRIGVTHERIGLEPRWYIGAYALYLSLLTPIVWEAFADRPEDADRALIALQRLLLLDSQLALEAYMESSEDDLENLNQELAQASRRLQTEFVAQRKELSQTARRARAAEELASIGTLVAGLAHEIGTPMGVIQGHAKLLEKSVDDEKAQWRLSTIQEQIGRISKIIQSLLNMARPKATERTQVDLEAVLENTLSFLTEKFNHRDVRLVRSFTPVPSVIGDPERLQQLCLNLFMNAADAMPDGGELSITLGPDPDGVELRIADSGVGIPARDLEHIFDPFFTSKDAGKGNGLGLTVAGGIVADHGGRIDVASETDGGTEFVIVLPITAPGDREDSTHS